MKYESFREVILSSLITFSLECFTCLIKIANTDHKLPSELAFGSSLECDLLVSADNGDRVVFAIKANVGLRDIVSDN